METISEYFNSIIFPHLGIFLKHVGDHISIGSFEIRFYGIIIMCGFILAYFLVTNEAKRTGQDPEMYLDFILILIIPVILGARIYYILFRLDQYIVAGNVKETILGMLNIRGGGLAIYGGVIAGMLRLADTATFGLLIGQILGRWGNFFNREAFGAYTDSVFAMGIPLDYYRHEGTLNSLINSGVISDTMLANAQTLHGMECITVHPTFLYESLWNLMLLIFLLIYRKHQKFTGEFAFIYVAGYGLGRCIIEGLRTDSLMIGNSGIRVSQLLGFACFLVGAVVLIVGYVRRAKGQLQTIENESVQAPSEDENN